MLIKPLLAATLETALNRYLALDENSHQLLYPLIGKVIALEIQPFNETLYFCPSADNIQIIDQVNGQPDTTISGSAWALGLMGMSASPMRSVFSGEIKIGGDIHVGKQFQELFKKLDIDLEGLLSRYIGSGPAARISGLFRDGQEWGKDSLQTFKMNVSEFLQEETRDLPAKAEIELFYHDVDVLRTAGDRLNSRIARLDGLLSKKPQK